MMKWYSNLKIGIKITIGFLLVAMIAGVIGIVGIVGLNQVGGAYAVAYTNAVIVSESMERISASFQEMRQDLLETVLADNKADKEACIDALKRHRGIIEEALIKYKAMLSSYKAEEVAEDLKLLGSVEIALNEFDNGSAAFVNSPAAMNPDRSMEAYRMLADGGELNILAQAMEEAIAELIKYNTDYAQRQVDANGKLATISEVTMVIGVGAGMLAAVLIGLWIARGISKPIGQIVEAADKLADGNFNIKIDIDSKDETGELARTFRRMSDTLKMIITDLSMGLDAFANGNFAVDFQTQEYFVGSYASLMVSMQKTRDSLSDTLHTINTAAEQVAVGSDQVSGGAQALASGSTEQAATVEELSASAEQIAQQAAENSAIVNTAVGHFEQANVGLSTGIEQMGLLTAAMDEIGSASSQIAGITKVIEDIAFQTNILALNATIEAARAGSAGKGFAVVADEVRNLAAKSAEAAKQTGELIQASVSMIARGSEMTAKTSRIIRDVGEITGKVNKGLKQIETSSLEQVGSIEQIRNGLNQVSAVVQTNAATAEENSATSEEMSAQAATLRGEVEKFKLKGNDMVSHAALSIPAHSRSEEDSVLSLADRMTFGKY